MRDELTIESDGSVGLKSPKGSELLTRRAGRYQVIVGPPGVLLLQALEGGATQSRVLAAGELVSKTTVLELVTMILNNGWSGELSLWDDAHTRRLRLDQGAIKAAHSDKPSERLGEVMVALGALTVDQLARCVLSASPQRRLGEIAIEQGFVDEKLLFAMLQAQAERIFQAALLLDGGSYAFSLLGDDSEAPKMTLHLPVQALLFESVQRIDEMAHFRERIPNGTARPVLTNAAARVTIGDSLRPIAALADGQNSIHDIGRALHLDEFTVTKKVMQLLQIGCVELKTPQVMSREAVERIVRQLNEVLREIEDTVERHGGAKAKKQMLWTLSAWVRDSPMSSYFGEGVGLDGDVSAETTLGLLLRLNLEQPLEGLHAATHEFVSFAMLCASPGLPREAERNLSKWVNQRLSRITL